MGVTDILSMLSSTEPKKTDSPVQSEEVMDKPEVLRQITNILAEYYGLESNIPVHHDYWSLTNKYRNM